MDSNVFVYMFDDTDVVKRQVATDLIQGGLDRGSGVISFQVVQEVLNVVTRKLATPMTRDDAERFLDVVLVPLWRVMPSLRLYQRALDFQVRHRYSFYDSMIIAAALDAGCTRLYTEDLHSGQRIDGLTISNPFGE